MPLIDVTYFDAGLTFIAQLDLVYNRNRINRLIAQYEPEYLNKVLGRGLSAAFIAGLENAEPEQRWLDLRDGKDFVYCGVKKRWNGFMNEGKISPIAMYVFYWNTRKQASPNTGSGNILPTVENGARTSFVRDGMTVWNQMIEANESLLEYLRANADSYPEWEPSRYVGFYGYHHIRRYCPSIDWDLFTPLNHLNI